MKSTLLFFLLCLSSLAYCQGICLPPIDVAVTTGYIWKNDCRFKEIYGEGIQDVITVDVCGWFSECFGIGLKGSYWEAEGRTPVCRLHTNVHEIPLIGYVRREIEFDCTFAAYASLGGGIIFVREKSELGKVNTDTWGGEAEIGLNYYFFKNFYLTTAFRYLYFKKKIAGIDERADFGGYGLRGGLGISF